MAVITISRNIGCHGDEIARQLAKALDYHYVDKELMGKILGQYGLVEFNREYDKLPGFWDKLNAQKAERRDMMVDMLNQVIRALARHGNVVIVGRGAFCVLEDYSDVLNVRLRAPFPHRINQVMEQTGVGPDEAEEIVQQTDEVQSTFVESFYGVPWDGADNFDLLVNTAKVPSERIVSWLTEGARELETLTGEDQLTTDSIQVASVLESAIASELQQRQ